MRQIETPKTPVVLFEDKHVLVAAKPSGLLSQGDSSGHPSLVDWARTHVGRHYVGLVHRLDRNVSGLVIVAKRSKAAQRLTDALQRNEISRVYEGVVWGKVKTKQKWVHFLAKDPRTNRTRVVPKGDPRAKEATMTAFPMEYGKLDGEHVTLCEFRLETGRSHQIRAQSAKMDHPIVGDPKYGPKRKTPISRPLLNACEVSFPHPMEERHVLVKRSIGEELLSYLH